MFNNIYSPFLTENDMFVLVKRQIDHFGSQRAFCKNLGVPTSDLSMYLTGARPASEKILSALGYQKVSYFVKKGSSID